MFIVRFIRKSPLQWREMYAPQGYSTPEEAKDFAAMYKQRLQERETPGNNCCWESRIIFVGD